jgi:hypothetical protein
VLDCNDPANPFVADVIGTCDMPELLSFRRLADLQSIAEDDEEEAPRSPVNRGPTCDGPNCGTSENPLTVLDPHETAHSSALPVRTIPFVPPAGQLLHFEEPRLAFGDRSGRLERPPRR